LVTHNIEEVDAVDGLVNVNVNAYTPEIAKEKGKLKEL
jgi:hypothetical protein